ncbi:hypothetical protein PQI23_12320 [Leucobacter sp. USCH14]|uniref:hypothetical protein n=1 Tax=Leucobacter sp. USCH14 TaxID=3024838 RepID=UPI0030A68D75
MSANTSGRISSALRSDSVADVVASEFLPARTTPIVGRAFSYSSEGSSMAVQIVSVNSWDTEWEVFVKLREIAQIVGGGLGEQLTDLLRVNAESAFSRSIETDSANAVE